jgi:hypothetical protein
MDAEPVCPHCKEKKWAKPKIKYTVFLPVYDTIEVIIESEQELSNTDILDKALTKAQEETPKTAWMFDKMAWDDENCIKEEREEEE